MSRGRLHEAGGVGIITIIGIYFQRTDYCYIRDYGYRCFQLRADSAVFGIGGNIERQHTDLAEQVFDGFEQPLRAALYASVA